MADRDNKRLGPRIVRPVPDDRSGGGDGVRADDEQVAQEPDLKEIKGIPGRWRDLVPGDHLPTLTDSFSLITEQFRLMRVKLDSSEMPGGGVPRVLAFTSSIPGEGKSCTALNTALVAAQEVGRKVCFVECDLRRRRVEALLHQPPKAGLSDLLQAKTPLKKVLLEMDQPDGLSIILAGSAPPNPVELLGSRIMERLVSHLRQSFDMVILDTPPALNFADASKLGPMVDGFIMVVRAGKAPRDAVLKVHRALSRYHVAGVVLNDVDKQSGADYGYYYRQYTNYGSSDGPKGRR